MVDLALSLRETALSLMIRESQWFWPICESIHFVGLALVLGIAGLFDFRLMGFVRHLSVASVKSLMPWAMVGFVLNLFTGAAFLIGAPDQYVTNPAWWAKVAALVLAGANAGIFESTMGGAALAIPAGGDTTGGMKAVGAVSLLSWLGVLYWGRMLPFIGSAF